MTHPLGPDPDAPHLVQVCCALVHVTRGKRKRFPESCVEVQPDEASALARARPAHNLHAAEVMGPSRSSEGLRLYYLVRWLSPADPG